jgi:hypothetical protein
VALAHERGVNFVVEPVPGSSTVPRAGYFLIPATPGGQVIQAIGVRYDAPGRLELRLATVDAVTGQLGGASDALETETPTRTGAWITLEPKESAVVSFRIAIPADAGSGEHLAGISVAAPPK